MAKRRSKNRPARRSDPQTRSRQILLLLTVVPMAVGLVLFVAAWADWVFLGTPQGQTLAGGILMLAGFAAANLVLRQWMLAAGWGLLAVALWLLVGMTQSWARIFGGVVGVAGVVLVLIEFARRYQVQRPKTEG